MIKNAEILQPPWAWWFNWLTDWLPSRVEVPKGVGDVAGHANDDGPFTAQIFDHDGRQEHGGDDDGGIDDAQRRHSHPLLCIQAALHRQDRTPLDARTVSHSYPKPLYFAVLYFNIIVGCLFSLNQNWLLFAKLAADLGDFNKLSVLSS